MQERATNPMSSYLFEIVWLIMIGVVGRLIPHFPNVTPLTGISLFVGKKLPHRLALVVVLITLLISDWGLFLICGYPLIGYFSLFTYSGFIAISLISARLKHLNNRYFILYVLGASLVFWIWTNFGVWLTSGLYPKTFAGLNYCYSMAVPYLRVAIVGDMVWCLIIFGLARVAEFGRRAGFRFQ